MFKESFKKLIDLLSIVVMWTPAKWDDMLLALALAIYQSPVLMEWFESYFNFASTQPDGALSIEIEPDAAIVQELRDRTGRDWKALLPYIKGIMELLKMLK
jgi:hypothetical protein